MRRKGRRRGRRKGRKGKDRRRGGKKSGREGMGNGGVLSPRLLAEPWRLRELTQM